MRGPCSQREVLNPRLFRLAHVMSAGRRCLAVLASYVFGSPLSTVLSKSKELQKSCEAEEPRWLPLFGHFGSNWPVLAAKSGCWQGLGFDDVSHVVYEPGFILLCSQLLCFVVLSGTIKSKRLYLSGLVAASQSPSRG
jgi:hypothetical protein